MEDSAQSLFEYASSEDWAQLATGAGQIGRWVLDPETSIVELDDTLRELTGMQDFPVTFLAEGFQNLIHPDDAEYVFERLERAREANQTYQAIFRFNRPDGKMIWLEGRGDFRSLPDGRAVFLGVNYDVTELQTAFEANRLLAGEMAHRVRNILTLVSGIFRMAVRSTDNLEELTDAFLGRLQALNALNALLFESEARSVGADELMRSILGPVAVDARFNLELADIALNSAGAQTIALVTNELMTNAVKHGALNDPEGHIDAELILDRDRDELVLNWDETMTTITAPRAPGASRFGMTVLDRMTRQTFEGRPEFFWRTQGLQFRCSWKASDMELRDIGPAMTARDVLVEVAASNAFHGGD